MIRRLYIDGYKSFKDFEIKLEPLSVIFGPNGSGKSNILDAIALISAFINSKDLQSAFKHHRGEILESFHFGEDGYEELLKKDVLTMTFEVDVELSERLTSGLKRHFEKTLRDIDENVSDQLRRPISMAYKIDFEKYLRYKLVINGHPKTGSLQIRTESLHAINKNGEIREGISPFIKTDNNKNVRKLKIEAIEQPISFPENSNSSLCSLVISGHEFPHVSAFYAETENWRTYYLEPKQMREPQHRVEAKHLESDGSNIAPFLNLMKHDRPILFRNLQLVLKTILNQEPNLKVEPVENTKVQILISEGEVQCSARLISDGTLRALGYLAALSAANKASVIAFEEPENGLHPMRLQLIARIAENATLSGDRQVIITTHSPILPDYFDDEQLFICKRDGSVTKIDKYSELPQYRKDRKDSRLSEKLVEGYFGG